MIKTKRGATTIKGTKAEVMADLTVIARNLVEVLGKEDVEYAIKRAFMSEEELDAEIEESIAKLEALLNEESVEELE